MTTEERRALAFTIAYEGLLSRRNDAKAAQHPSADVRGRVEELKRAVVRIREARRAYELAVADDLAALGEVVQADLDLGDVRKGVTEENILEYTRDV